MLLPLTLALLACSPDPAARTEHFVLEEPAEDGTGVPVAVIALRRVPTENGLLLEQEVQFRRAGLRMLIDEHHGARGDGQSTRLVWRELRSSPENGRTWLAEWDEERGEVRTANHGTRAPVHAGLEGPEPTWPLALVEALRRGAAPAEVETLDPLARARTSLRVRARVEHGRRHYELVHADGSLARAYVFEGHQLVALRLQGGARVARPCDAGEFERLATEWERRHDPLSGLRALSRKGRVRPR